MKITREQLRVFEQQAGELLCRCNREAKETAEAKDIQSCEYHQIKYFKHLAVLRSVVDLMNAIDDDREYTIEDNTNGKHYTTYMIVVKR